jgi:glutaredoxin 3
MNIVIYTKSNCPNCTTAKALLNSKGIGYLSHDIEANQLAADGLRYRAPNARQMPAIFINDQFVGGLAGLQNALKELGL